MKERSMHDYYLYLALFAPHKSPYSLARSALPDAPVLPAEQPGRPAGRLRRGAARVLFGLAEQLDPQAGHVGPDWVQARQSPA
jgi:hypothetical protein